MSEYPRDVAEEIEASEELPEPVVTDSGVAGDLGYLPLPDAAAEAIQSGWRAQFGPAR